MECLFCGHDLDDPAARSSFDPWLGRLWRVCPACSRWNVIPLEDRWERLESLERAARDRGRSLLRTEHLDLVDADGVQLIRVGRAPRPELAGWRYGDFLPPPFARSFLARVRQFLLGLPSAPFGYDSGYGHVLKQTDLLERRWFASPFLDDALGLTTAFLTVPLAPSCPSCGGPLAIAPWTFQNVLLTLDGGEPAAVATCALCDSEVLVSLHEARPALRLGLGIVNRRERAWAPVQRAALTIEQAGGPEVLLRRLGMESETLGALEREERLALGMALDEQLEAELLEAEWRHAEELAAIVDGQLSDPAGFDEFRARVLS